MRADGEVRLPLLGRLGGQLLAASVLLALVPLAISNVAGYLISSSAFRRVVQDDLEKSARLEAQDLDEWLGARRSVLAAVAGSVVAANGQVLAAEEVETTLVEALVRLPDVFELGVIDAQGSLVAGTDPEFPLPACAAPNAERGLSDPVRAVLTVAVPRTSASLCGVLDLGGHERMLRGRGSEDPQRAVMVVDGSGRVLYGNQAPGLPQALELGGGEARWDSGEDWFLAYSPAAAVPWRVVVGVPHELALEPLESQKRRGMWFGAGLALVTLVAVVLLAQRMVRPLNALAAFADRIAQGSYGETIPVGGQDEIARLAAAFNRMSAALRTSYEELDGRVSARTRELQESRDFLDSILDALDHPITVVSSERRVVKANLTARRRYGAGVVGQQCCGVLATCSGGCERCAVSTVLATGIRTRSQLPPGNVGPDAMVVDGFPLTTRHGVVREVILLERVVTEERRLQAQLVRQEKMAAVGQLAAGFAHEIGNPLSSITSELEMIELCPNPEGDAASLRVVREQVDRVARLLRQFTDLTRLPDHAPSALDLGALVEDVAALVRHDPRCRGVVIETAIHGSALVWCDADRVHQVVLNLCLNALDALPGEGRVAISVRREGTEVVVDVTDDGKGIEPDVLGRVFDPFFTTKPPGKGTGLGLYVTARIVADLDGQIEVASRLGHGTSFKVKLPAYEQVTADVR